MPMQILYLQVLPRASNITPRACARQGVKQSVLSIYHHKITISGDLDVIARCKYHIVSRRWENVPSSRWAMSAIHVNRVFLSTTPFDHTQLCRVLPQLHMLRLSIGKGRQ